MAGLAELGETWDSPRMQLPCTTRASRHSLAPDVARTITDKAHQAGIMNPEE